MTTPHLVKTKPDYKLEKMLPLLGSDRPGEVLAAAAAIDRHLRANGQDWHDLAAALRPDRAQRDPSDPQAVAAWLPQSGHYRPHERDFLWNVQRGIRLTPKQLDWLAGIYTRARV
jgi:hypothetical protein